MEFVSNSYPVNGKTFIQCNIRDITERKQMEKDICESRDRLSAISKSSHDALVVMNDQGEVTLWNPASERIFGYTDSQILGRKLHDVLAPEQYRNAYQAGIDRFAETGQGSAIGLYVGIICSPRKR